MIFPHLTAGDIAHLVDCEFCRNWYQDTLSYHAELSGSKVVRFRARWQKLGAHIHCRFFQLTEPSTTWQKCGELTFDEESWLTFQQMTNVEILPE